MMKRCNRVAFLLTLSCYATGFRRDFNRILSDTEAPEVLSDPRFSHHSEPVGSDSQMMFPGMGSDDMQFEFEPVEDLRVSVSMMKGSSVAGSHLKDHIKSAVVDLSLSKALKSGVDISASSKLKIVRASGASEVVKEAKKEFAGIVGQSMFQTTLEFSRGKTRLRAAAEASLPAIQEWINKEQEATRAESPGCKFHFCTHVGTTETEGNVKPELMDGRSSTLVSKLQEGRGEDTFVETSLPHFQCHRFAGFIMKAYTGDETPPCKPEDVEAPPISDEKEKGKPQVKSVKPVNVKSVKMPEPAGIGPDLLAAIQKKDKALKPVQAKPPVENGRNGLLAEINKGPALKHVQGRSPSGRAPKPSGRAPLQSGDGGIMGALAAEMAKRRGNIAMESAAVGSDSGWESE